MIVASAIKTYIVGYNYPIIWTGKRHADILQDMFSRGVKYNRIKLFQGFYTNNDRFLDRYEAKLYAMECGQIKYSEYAELYSEDLWPE